MATYDISATQKAIVAYSTKGEKGDPGSGTVDADALHVSQRLSEFSTPTAKQEARANLELDIIDAGTFN